MPVSLSIRRDGHHFFEDFFGGILPITRQDGDNPNGRNAPKPA